MHILNMTVDDLPRVGEIQRRTYPAELQEPLSILEKRRSLAPQFCLIARVDQAVAAYLIAHPWSPDSSPGLNADLDRLPDDASVLHLHDLAVDLDFRGMRLAHRLFEALLQEARDHNFADITLVAVGDARPFWERLGFFAQYHPAGYDAQAVFMARTVM